MAECAIGQPGYSVVVGSVRAFGHTPAEACSAYRLQLPENLKQSTGWNASGVCVEAGTARPVIQVCTPPEIKPGEVGPVTLTAACPASAPCVFSMFTDGSIPTEITPASTVTAIAFGLGAVLSFFAIGYVIGVATGLIKKA